MNLGRLGRQARRSMRFSKWPLRRRIAVVAWIPVLVLWFLLYTGPNSAANSEAPATTSTTLPYIPPQVLPTAPPQTVPENGLLVGALPDVTPKLPPIVSDQYRILIDQASRISAAQKRPSAAVTRELNRIQNALRRALPAAAKEKKIAARDEAKKKRILRP